MNIRLSCLAIALLAGGLIVVAEEKDKKKKHECPVGDIFCPAEGCCEGMCRTYCDKAGEALATVKTRTATLVATLPKEQQERLARDRCLEKEYIGPELKEKVNAAFSGKAAKHEVKKGNKTEDVKCTFLNGKACEPCLDEMTKAVNAKLEALKPKESK